MIILFHTHGTPSIDHSQMLTHTLFSQTRRESPCGFRNRRSYRLILAVLTSKLELLAESRLPLIILLLELLRRCLLRLSGSVGCKPDARAKRFKISVRLTTPANCPPIFAPGSAEAETEGVLLRDRKGGFDCGREERWVGGCETEGWESCGIGVEVREGEGESVTHIL